jgi:hypothetical protein
MSEILKRPVVTWAALAAIVQLGAIVVPGVARVSSLETKVEHVERGGSAALQQHIAESNARYTEVIRQLTRIETKLERRR